MIGGARFQILAVLDTHWLLNDWMRGSTRTRYVAGKLRRLVQNCKDAARPISDHPGMPAARMVKQNFAIANVTIRQALDDGQDGRRQ
jgi:hypothetical protein